MKEIRKALQLINDFGYEPNIGPIVYHFSDLALAAQIHEPEEYLEILNLKGHAKNDKLEELAFIRTLKAWDVGFERYKNASLKEKHYITIDFINTHSILKVLPGLIGEQTMGFLNERRKFISNELAKSIAAEMYPIAAGLSSEDKMNFYTMAFNHISIDSAENLIKFLDGSLLPAPVYWLGSASEYIKFQEGVSTTILKNCEMVLNKDVFEIWFRIIEK